MPRILLTSDRGSAQEVVYFVHDRSLADEIVYVVSSREVADKVVYKTSDMGSADKKVFETSSLEIVDSWDAGTIRAKEEQEFRKRLGLPDISHGSAQYHR